MKDQAVSYFVGDLCYVLHDVWDEVCSLISYDNIQSGYQLRDGRKFFLLGTAYGDGTYEDQNGRIYGVDSGTLGAIKETDIRDSTYKRSKLERLGNFVEMPELSEFECYDDMGLLVFGSVEIQTGDSFQEEELEEF